MDEPWVRLTDRLPTVDDSSPVSDTGGFVPCAVAWYWRGGLRIARWCDEHTIAEATAWARLDDLLPKEAPTDG